MQFPATVPVEKIDAKHPEYSACSNAWSEFGMLYEGGYQFKAFVSQFLKKNVKELGEVYMDRSWRIGYTNLLGNIIGWYQSAAFKVAPQIVKRTRNTIGEKSLVIPRAEGDWCADFEKDCDRGGKKFIDLFRDCLESILLYRRWYCVLDLPIPSESTPLTLGEQRAQGLLDAYLCGYSPESVINWQVDGYGVLEWATIKITVESQAFLEDPKITDYWYHFDRQHVALYECDRKQDSIQIAGSQQVDPVATLAVGYPRPHALSDRGQVPIWRVELPKGLWLANRVYLMLLNHLNLDNTLDFGLNKSNLAQLVIEGKYDDNVVVSEVGYHQLEVGGKMYYLEPEGKAFETSSKRLETLEERIYKACYLQDQARTNRSTPTAQSGISKQQDKTPSRDVLSAMGDILRTGMQEIYQTVVDIRGFEIDVDVRGFDFSDKFASDDLDFLEKASVIPVNSTRYEREIQKMAARLTLPDANEETIQAIDDEIDASPTPSEQAMQQQEANNAAMSSKFEQSLKSIQAA